MARPLLELTGITKRYGDLLANDDVSLRVAPGEVVAMLGENGAGKSTLMKVVYGLVRPDAGTIAVDGTPLDIASPKDAMAAGIGMVTQEFSLVETMTVTDNIALSGVGLGRVDRAETRRRVVEAMERVGVTLDPDRLVGSLSIGERQRVEIVKALFHDCRVVILDEPTAVLTPQDVRALFETVRRLRTAGLGILLVSHKLREVAEISDRVVVLRRGRLVGERATATVRDEELAALMMGGSTDEVAATTASGDGEATELEAAVGMAGGPAPATRRPHPAAAAEPVLRLSGLTVSRGGREVLRGIDLTVHGGEIVGLAGVSGNGQTELVEVLSATLPVTSGTLEVAGQDVTSAGVGERLAAGLGRLTEDRRGSVVPQMSVEYNLVLEDLPAYTRRGLLDRTAVRAHAEAMIERFDIRARPTDAVATLSGGNMQKVLLARALARRPRVLVVAQPTRGLDIGAYRYVHQQLDELRSEGAGVLLVSEDLDELRALSDRVVVLFGGEVVGELPVAEASPDRLGVLMAGGGSA
ncbi:ABC transporter ATP-binding protein [Nocardioides marmotae]|uniref:ABC transporter ATP-binding protein n=1 Tax=Nocardioides marmotae TaxID=2663857 RepID=UPI0013286D13|nr:ABC transporter ATP-binding protein [Nocardioides marmotae]MTB85894.1 ATP-binding cassette domain-containing protein [Nocardioides marmotae]